MPGTIQGLLKAMGWDGMARCPLKSGAAEQRRSDSCVVCTVWWEIHKWIKNILRHLPSANVNYARLKLWETLLKIKSHCDIHANTQKWIYINTASCWSISREWSFNWSYLTVLSCIFQNKVKNKHLHYSALGSSLKSRKMNEFK